MARRTLAEMNAQPFRREWAQYTVERQYAVGKLGRRQSGTKVHLLSLEVIVEERGEHKPGTFKVGSISGCRSHCNGNGQHNSLVLKGLDTDAITCSKC